MLVEIYCPFAHCSDFLTFENDVDELIEVEACRDEEEDECEAEILPGGALLSYKSPLFLCDTILTFKIEIIIKILLFNFIFIGKFKYEFFTFFVKSCARFSWNFEKNFQNFSFLLDGLIIQNIFENKSDD